MNDTTPNRTHAQGPTPDAHEVGGSGANDVAGRLAELEAIVARQADALDAAARRTAELDATVARLVHTAGHDAGTADTRTAGDRPMRALPLAPADHEADPAGRLGLVEPVAEPHAGRGTFDRRRLLSRAGTAAVGAVIGGAAASIAAASPAAAASASFDSSAQGTPAVTASNTAGGTGVSASSNGGKALLATSTAQDGSGVAISVVSEGLGLDVTTKGALGSRFVHTGPTAAGIVVQAVEGSIGLVGQAKDFGVLGLSGSPQGTGVSGGSTGGLAGVSGDGKDGAAGVMAYSDAAVGVVAVGKRAQLRLRGTGEEPVMPPPRTRDDAHGAGEVYFDDQQSLWLCVADGTPGTWVRLGGLGTAGAFTVLPQPVRVYDSRSGTAPTDVGPKTPLAAATPRSIDLTRNSSGVPTDAVAATVAATVTNTTGGSPSGPAFLSLYASGPWPGTSNLNWTAPGATIAVTTVVPLAVGATLTAYASAGTDVVVDVVGYFR